LSVNLERKLCNARLMSGSCRRRITFVALDLQGDLAMPGSDLRS
jgi:hypothetical protein